MSTRAPVAAIAALALAICACGEEQAASPTPQAPTESSADSLAEWKQLAQGDRAEIERKLEQRVDELHEALARWQQSAQAKGAAEYDAALASLRENEAAVRGQLETLRRSTADNWHELCDQTQKQAAQFADECRRLFEQR